MVAPNGARLSKADHPALPLTVDEIVACAADCFTAGADGLHAHIRDNDGSHLLDAQGYRELLSELRQAVPDMALQITTEAAGVYEPDIQMDVALTAGADMVSASIREISRAGHDTARSFYAECGARQIAIQHILYDLEDCQCLVETLPLESRHDPRLQLLFVLGRYGQTGESSPEELGPFLTWMRENDIQPDWALCAFGAAETECLLAAVRNGGKCRVGFENSLFLSDGRIASNNAEKTTDLLRTLEFRNK